MTRRLTKIFGYGTVAMATVLIASMSVPDRAQAQPAQDELWALECRLGNGAINTVNGLIQDMTAADTSGKLGTPTVAFVVIYTLRNNDGEPLKGVTDPEGAHTGPVICRNTAVVAAPTLVEQTQSIGGSGSTLNLLDLENAASLRYNLDGQVQKRYCHTVEGGSKCVKFTPASAP